MSPGEREPNRENGSEQPNPTEQREITSQDFTNAWNHIHSDPENRQPLRETSEMLYVQEKHKAGELDPTEAAKYIQAIATADDKQMMLIDAIGMDNPEYQDMHEKVEEVSRVTDNQETQTALKIIKTLREQIIANDARVIEVAELAHKYINDQVGIDIRGFEYLWDQRQGLDNPHNRIEKQVKRISIDATRRYNIRDVLKLGKQKEEQGEKEGTEYTELWEKLDFQPARTIDIVELRKRIEELESESEILELIDSIQEIMGDNAAEFLASLVDEETEEEEEKIDEEKEAIFTKLQDNIESKLTGDRKKLAPEIVSTLRNIGFDVIEVPAITDDEGNVKRSARIELFINPTSKKLDPTLKRLITKSTYNTGKTNFTGQLNGVLGNMQDLSTGTKQVINSILRDKIEYPGPATAKKILLSIQEKEKIKEEEKAEDDENEYITSRAMCVKPNSKTPTHNVVFITKEGSVRQKPESKDSEISYRDGTEFFATPSMSFKI